jgi:hypothetical protein
MKHFDYHLHTGLSPYKDQGFVLVILLPLYKKYVPCFEYLAVSALGMNEAKMNKFSSIIILVIIDLPGKDNAKLSHCCMTQLSTVMYHVSYGHTDCRGIMIIKGISDGSYFNLFYFIARRGGYIIICRCWL